MVSQDQEKQDRLLHFAGWLYHEHQSRTRAYGSAFTEVQFTREDLGNVPALQVYGLDRGDAGEQALHLDTGALAAFGIEVRWSARNQAWVSRMVPLTDAECRALATAAFSVIVEDGSPTPTGYHIPGAGLTVEGAELTVAYTPVIDQLIEALQARSSVKLIHRGLERTVDPWQVFMTDGRWYVVGRDHDADDRRAFAIDAITSAELHGVTGSFSIPAEDFIELSRIAIDPDEWTSAEPVEVTLDVDKRLVGRAEALLGAERVSSTMSDGWVPMVCTVRHVDAFLTRLWGLRARVVVIGPPAIRDRVISALKEMA